MEIHYWAPISPLSKEVVAVTPTCGWLPFLSRKGQVRYSNRHSFFEGDDANSTGVEGDD